MSRTVLRLIVAILCFVGIVLGGTLAPVIGVQTPVPDLGVENGNEESIGEGVLVNNGPANSSSETNGQSSSSSGELSGAAGEFVENVETSDGGVPVESGASNYGGVSSGGYPQESSVGGPLSLSDQIELRVESPQPSRWRLGAYANYTGDGWDRQTTESEQLSGLLPTVDGTSTPAYEIRVTPQRSFDSLVTAWRPAYATAPNRKVSVTKERGLVLSEPVTAGDTYVTATYGTPSHTTAAEAAGEGSVPSEIRDQYTQLPEKTPKRLGDRTAEITADAETPYETAAAVQLWLTENKEYSLDAEHDRSNDIATEFVLEMDAGYCEYFATSMVAMLRTQDVPARYVTGYGPGEEVSEDEYVVRGQDAHAWVEVYITDVGWVTFDPTPASGRVNADRDVAPTDGGGPTSGGQPGNSNGQTPGASESGSDEKSSENRSESGESSDNKNDSSTNETEGGESGQDSESDTSGDSTKESGSEDDTGNSSSKDDRPENESEETETAPLNIELASDPVPGRDLTVTVTRDSDPVSGAAVSFNGDLIGETDATGNVTGEVPYTKSLEVVARTESSETQASLLGSGALPLGGGNGLKNTGGKNSKSFRQFAGGDGVNAVGTTSRVVTDRGENVTVDVPVNITVNVVGEPIAGEPVDIIATIASEPVSNGTVRVNGTAVGQTGSNGQATVTLPDTEAAVINVSRSDATGSRTLSVGQLSVSVAPSTGVPLPLTESVVTATFNGDPVPNASITVDNETATVTGVNGTASVRLPFIDSASITATASIGGTSTAATKTIGNLYRNLAGVVGLAIFGLGSVIAAAHRRGISARSLSRSTVQLVVRLFKFGIAGLVRFATVVEVIISALRRSLLTIIAALRQGFSGVRQLTSAVLAGGLRLLTRLVTTLRALPQYLHPLVILATLKQAREAGVDAISTSAGSSHPDSMNGSEVDEALLTIRDAWEEFRTHVSIRSWRTATPGEIARWAIHRDDLPQEAVQTLTDAFRDVEYGSRSPSDYAPAARQALEAIQDATDADNEEAEK